MNDYRDYLMHHGIRGMKWGVRRFQNEDGSYKPGGEEHDDKKRARDAERRKKRFRKIRNTALLAAAIGGGIAISAHRAKHQNDDVKKLLNESREGLKRAQEVHYKVQRSNTAREMKRQAENLKRAGDKMRSQMSSDERKRADEYVRSTYKSLKDQGIIKERFKTIEDLDRFMLGDEKFKL